MIIKKQFGIFDWQKYILNNKDLKHLKSNKEAFSHFIKTGINEAKLFYFIIQKNIQYEFFNLHKYITIKNIKNNKLTKSEAWELFIKEPNKNLDVFDYIKINNLNVSFDDFDWVTYLHINTDIFESGNNTKIKTWEHWNNYGMNEERAFSYINNSNIHNGRFGNLFFINMFLHIFSKQFDLQCSYKYYDKFTELGINLNIGTKIYNSNLLITEKNFELFLDTDKNHIFKPSNIIIHNDIWLQSKNFCLYLYKYFNNLVYKNKIIMSNVFKERYNNNNDLFIHIRLGDVQSNTLKVTKYYDNLLSKLNFENGYISSDSIQNETCKYFIKKYNLNIVNYNEVKTIMFGSTCNNIILSGGTFSWLIGFFAFYSENIYYPYYENPWFGDIFETNTNWICINKNT
jgi:hypothetical protein